MSDDLIAEFTLEPTVSLDAEFTLESPIGMDAVFEIDVANKRHNILINRDFPDQHPISAITGLEKALDDIGQSTEALDEKINEVKSDLVDEITNRENADTSLSNKIDKEINDRVQAISDLDEKLDTEVNKLDKKIEDEIDRSSARENEIDEKLDTINTSLTKQIDDLKQDTTDKYNELTEDIDNLSDTVDSNYNTLDTKIDKEINDRTQAISDLNTLISDEVQRATNRENEIEGNLNTEITTRKNADKDLSDKIDTVEEELTEDIDSLTTIVENNYTTLDTRITNVADELGKSIEDNVVALQNEDIVLQNQINAHSQTLTSHDTRITNNANAITKEMSDRTTADSELQDSIDAEVKARSDADDNLQDQIDTLSARGRFLALWDATTGLPESNPKISPYTYKAGDYFIVDKVGETNYRPTGTEFVIGQASTEIETEELATDDVYYFDGATWHLQINHGKTVSFANLAGEPSDNINLLNALNDKQNVISDLNTIRSNATAGKTAKDTIDNYGDIVTHNVSEFQEAGDYATKTELTQGLSNKQDNLTAGENITITNNVISAVDTDSFADLQGDPYDNEALANELNSLDILSIINSYLKDSSGNLLADNNGLRLTINGGNFNLSFTGQEINTLLTKANTAVQPNSLLEKTTEEWVFTLVDGSTVTKKVIIG